MADAYAIALEKARLEVERLTQQKELIERKLARLAQTIAGLGAIVEGTDIKPAQRLTDESSNLTKTILAVFKLSDKPLTPTEVRDKTEELGYTWKNRDNAIQMVHVVLKRLVEKGELVKKASVSPQGVTYELHDIPF